MGLSDPIRTWPLFRQLAGPDRSGRGAAAPQSSSRPMSQQMKREHVHATVAALRCPSPLCVAESR